MKIGIAHWLPKSNDVDANTTDISQQSLSIMLTPLIYSLDHHHDGLYVQSVGVRNMYLVDLKR